MANKVDDVHNKVDDMHNKVEDIHKYLVRSKRSATLLPSDAAIRQEIPLKPEVFYGRDDFVQDIAQLLLQEETSRVCILGPGGMGKTSVSLAVVESPSIEERFPGRNLVWVPCIEATSATLLLEILYIQLQVPGDKQVALEKIISELDTSNEPRLILLDNFETPWNVHWWNSETGWRYSS
jgi:Cdc6-like AAA superfamily ATPase